METDLSIWSIHALDQYSTYLIISVGIEYTTEDRLKIKMVHSIWESRLRDSELWYSSIPYQTYTCTLDFRVRALSWQPSRFLRKPDVPPICITRSEQLFTYLYSHRPRVIDPCQLYVQLPYHKNGITRYSC